MPIEDKPAPRARRKSRPTKLELTVETFGTDIVRGKYAGSTSLPSEAELCATYGVSRATLREVVKMLAFKGLIVIHKHRGLFLQERRNWNYLDTDVLHWALSDDNSYEMIQALLETRAVIEPAIAGWAALRATANDLARMETAIQDMERFYYDKERFNAADVAFHTALTSAAQNVVIEQLGRAVAALQIAVFDVTYFPNETTKEITIRQHTELLEAVRLKKPSQAKKISTRMIAGVSGRINEKFGREGPRGTRRFEGWAEE
ncbi:MAG: FadR/GntR family transcriptional regulator [Tropicimonas sp.]|uniref:FadR/GntR family transcriptional regulator n=1 Tax=Tropicimonas sp. TaxID=2067044 RepID=UPI003A86559F